jgi:hypothetical protein
MVGERIMDSPSSWAHLLRVVDDCDDSAEGKRLSADIHLKFDELKEILGKDPLKKGNK